MLNGVAVKLRMAPIIQSPGKAGATLPGLNVIAV